MNIMYRLMARTIQLMYRIAAHFLDWRKPELIISEDSMAILAKLLKDKNLRPVLIVTDKKIMAMGLLDHLLNQLKKKEIAYIIFDETVPNPTIENIEVARKRYIENECKAIIGFGGGSAIDCAKGVGARIARPKKSIPQMKGQLKVGKKTPPIIAIPTTAGTGSEATLAAVVTNPKTQEKYAINDVHLIPSYAIHDPLLTVKLPAQLTATTGMDALTHAVEAYIGKSNTKETKKYAIKAVKLIFEHLEEAYFNPSNMEARSKMLKASYYAGLAFTRAYVGNVHAIAHTFGGFYNVPHGLANAIILPYVLTYYGKKVDKQLSELADLVDIRPQGKQKKSQAFIEEIKKMNTRMKIANKIEIDSKEQIANMVERAYQEANPLYPVPKILSKKDFTNLYNQIIKIK
ncbi:MAG: iron-containing alcohol dehydrogenase [Bacilli bacterium]|nr:iron-containing alcohol dehydrogenase [Bacilli bacterium]